MKKKLFAFDLDGTLLYDWYENIHPETLQALKIVKSQGHILAIATGRSISWTKPIVKKYPNLFDYLICNNGAAYFDIKRQKVVFAETLDISLFDAGMQIVKDHKTFLTAHGARKVYIPNTYLSFKSQDDKWVREFLKNTRNSLDPEIIREELAKDTFLQMSLKDSEEKVKLFKNILEPNFSHLYDFVITNRVYLDVNPKYSTKFNGLQKVLAKEKITANELIAFGDSDNDIEMIKGASLGFAMAEATEDLKAVATETIGSFDKGSIGKKLKQILNIY